mmetsp:Transcript_11198/g.22635  ORF Transcript_11198/g.22635 Transcript_11198/m.22635 type:complete len:223 (+) Transcript_11198:1465-2133(+)
MHSRHEVLTRDCISLPEALTRDCISLLSRYQGLDDDAQREMARLAAGTLPSALHSRLSARVSGEDEARFVHYSAHDNTLLALLAHIGIRNAPIPEFAAYLVFELHSSGEAVRSPFVRIAYNCNPSACSVAQQLYLCMRAGDQITEFSAAVTTAEESTVTLDEFLHRLFVERRSFESAAAWRSSSDGITPVEGAKKDKANAREVKRKGMKKLNDKLSSMKNRQ